MVSSDEHRHSLNNGDGEGKQVQGNRKNRQQQNRATTTYFGNKDSNLAYSMEIISQVMQYP